MLIRSVGRYSFFQRNLLSAAVKVSHVLLLQPLAEHVVDVDPERPTDGVDAIEVLLEPSQKGPEERLVERLLRVENVEEVDDDGGPEPKGKRKRTKTNQYALNFFFKKVSSS